MDCQESEESTEEYPLLKRETASPNPNSLPTFHPLSLFMRVSNFGVLSPGTTGNINIYPAIKEFWEFFLVPRNNVVVADDGANK